MTLLAPLLSLALLSALSWSAAGSSVLCSWTKVLPNGDVHYNFLRQASPSRRLYHSVWSGERALRSCAWSDDAAVTHSYSSACRERAHEFSDHPDATINAESVLAAEELCVSVGSGGTHAPAESHDGRAERSEVTTHRRVKRGLIVPGTLWCGSGNKAPSYADLGVFADTDSCCREHDHCKNTIPSFHSQFGVFNSNIFTMSHCDCDNKFHCCLMAARDSISEVVGYTFFNLLKMHCFEFSHRLQCTERNWFGMCKETKMSLYAVVHPPRLYDSPNATEVSVNATKLLDMSNSSAAAAPTPPPEVPEGPPPECPAGSPHEDPTGPSPERDDRVINETGPGQNITEKQRSECDVFKDLDRCRNKIRPQQRRYGLLNPDARMLYHCNCTSRLFQTLAEQRQLTDVQEVLLGRVSESCFLSPDCSAGKNCSAVLMRADLPPEGWSSRANLEQQRPLEAAQLKATQRPLEAAQLKAARPRRRDGAVRLHKLCLRAVRSEAGQNRTRTRGPAA